MQIDLADKVALVTGGAQGIGRAIVAGLIANGARVAIVDIDEAAARRTVAEFEAEGTVAAWTADVSDTVQMQAAAADVIRRWGRIDILVNNAGLNTRKDRRPIHEFADEDWERILRVDLTGVFVTSRAVIPHLIQSGGGRIVNIASVVGLVPLRLQRAFVAAKAGVINLTRSMALELATHRILVNAVAPGSTLTDGTRALFYGADGAYSEKAVSLLAHIPLARPAEPEEIAHAVLFLVAPEASYVTGSVVTVDGGWTAGYTRDW